MLLFTESDVRRLLPMKDCVGVLRSAFAAYAKGEAQISRAGACSAHGSGCTSAGCLRKLFRAEIYSTHPSTDSIPVHAV